MSEKAMSTKSNSLANAVDIPWWLLLIDGIALVLLGLLFFINPELTSRLLVLFLGVFWFIAGILKIVHIFFDKRHWGWKLLAGILGIVAGLLVIGNNVFATLLTGATLVIAVGFLGLFFGTVELIQAFQGGGWGAGILGVVSMVTGVLVLINTLVMTLALPAILGALCVIGGIAVAAIAFQLRRVVA
jgi:uncharacterized membrane protein HdeD (DUF308 family)